MTDGFGEITLRRYDALQFGNSLDRAVEMNLALGPAAEAQAFTWIVSARALAEV